LAGSTGGHDVVMSDSGDRPEGPERDTGRLEAFSDGVLAVIITIMALELRTPATGGFHSLGARAPELLIYVLSFAFVGIYWNNHHHLLRSAPRISGTVMWTNLHLLFWLSLVPFLTDWVGEHWQSTAPVATYAVVALACALAYTMLQMALVRAAGGSGSQLAQAIGSDRKGRISLLAYLAAFGLAFVSPIISYALFVAVALMWFVPDRRLQKAPGL
jgi:uncharacterized membrane protein